MKFSPLGIVALALLTIGCKDKTETVRPSYQPIVESVYASATIKAAQQYTLYPAMSGRILQFLLKEGDRVSAGQLIAHLDNTGAALSASTAGEAVTLSKMSAKQLQEIQAQLSTAVEQAKLDSLNYKRQQNLWAQNIGSLSQLEAKKLAAAASKNAVKALQSKLPWRKANSPSIKSKPRTTKAVQVKTCRSLTYAPTSVVRYINCWRRKENGYRPKNPLPSLETAEITSFTWRLMK